MGKILQITVSAWTYREEDVEKTWPKLTRLVWTKQQSPREKRGVLELVTAILDGITYEKWPKKFKNTIQVHSIQATTIKNDLEAALADWEPIKANKLSDMLEDTLTSMEECIEN